MVSNLSRLQPRINSQVGSSPRKIYWSECMPYSYLSILNIASNPRSGLHRWNWRRIGGNSRLLVKSTCLFSTNANSDRTFPDYLDTQVLNLDGVVVNPGTLPNGTIPQYNLGITLVHEIGHWLGLLHTFQEPDGPFINFGTGCTGDGDYVYDTPAEQSPAFGCQEVLSSSTFW